MKKELLGQPEFTNKLLESVDKTIKTTGFDSRDEIFAAIEASGMKISKSTWERLLTYDVRYKPYYCKCFAKIFDDSSWLEFKPLSSATAKLQSLGSVTAEAHDGSNSDESAPNSETRITALLPSESDENEAGSVLNSPRFDPHEGLNQAEIELSSRESLFKKEFGGNASTVEERAALLRFRNETGVTDDYLKSVVQNNLYSLDEQGNVLIKAPHPYWFEAMRIFNYGLLLIVGLALLSWDLYNHLEEPLPLLRFGISWSAWASVVLVSMHFTMRPLEVARQLNRRQKPAVAASDSSDELEANLPESGSMVSN